MSVELIQGDCVEVLRTLPESSVHCCISSPPYFGLRDYQIDGQIGLEATPDAFVAKMVEVFREVRRVLRDDGTCWLNLGDSFASGTKAGDCGRKGHNASVGNTQRQCQSRAFAPGLATKQLIGIPWRVAFALQADGWYLRSDIIWCLSGGAWVYARTQKGDMPAMIKDLVRLNPATVQLWNGTRWTRVLGWNRSPDPERRIEIVLRSGERIGCTGNHQWPTRRGNVPASGLRSGDVIRTCNLPDPADAKRPPYLTDDAMWFLGLYLAEGSMADDTIQISGHADEIHRVERVASLARHYGGTSAHTVDGNNLAIRVYSRVIKAILDTYIGGRVAADKHLKVAAWSLPSPCLKVVALGYLEGDGHVDPMNDRVRLGFCRNYALERDLRTLAARLGATLTLKPVIATSQRGKHPAFRGEWRWERSGHGNEKDRGEVVEIRASKGRIFWDIGVEDEPHLFSLASGVLTHNSKPNPMPESVRDRPTKAHEYLFLLSKSERYFYDREAIREPIKASSGQRMRAPKSGGHRPTEGYKVVTEKAYDEIKGANRRSVWTVATKPFKSAHFATFPPKLIEPCLLAGTSEAGCCPGCGTPWERVVERTAQPPMDWNYKPGDDPMMRTRPRNSGPTLAAWKAANPDRDLGFRPACPCDAGAVPCTVLDPFSGAGTTGVVAKQHGRSYVGIDINAKYLEMSRRRLRKVTPYLPMFAGPIERPEPRPGPVAVEPAYPLFRE